MLFDKEHYLSDIAKFKCLIDRAEAIVIGAGPDFSGDIERQYSTMEFNINTLINTLSIDTLGCLNDLILGRPSFIHSLEEYWLFWAEAILERRYENPPEPSYKKLLKLVKDKNYFVVTTNIFNSFQRAGFENKRLFCAHGDEGRFQCSAACHNKTYDNEEFLRKIAIQQPHLEDISKIMPCCPICGSPMVVNTRYYYNFIKDNEWQVAHKRYETFINENKDKRILFIELCVGNTTPIISKYSFSYITATNPKAHYVNICVDFSNYFIPYEIRERALSFSYASQVITDILEY